MTGRECAVVVEQEVTKKSSGVGTRGMVSEANFTGQILRRGDEMVS